MAEETSPTGVIGLATGSEHICGVRLGEDLLCYCRASEEQLLPLG